jgi:hypothetical protein
MVTPPSTATVAWSWKRFALKWILVGVGVGLVGVVAVGLIVWFTSRPKPPEPWNTNALIARTPPGFSVHDNGKKLRFSYAVENTTERDYQVDSKYEVKVLIETLDGSLSQPLPDEAKNVGLPIFIPAKQTGTIVLELMIPGIPTQVSGETEDEYHERVRAFCETRLGGVKGFALFDEINRYRIHFPRWLSERPQERSGTPNNTDPLGLRGPGNKELTDCLNKANPSDPAGLYDETQAQATARKACIEKYGHREPR